MKRGALDDAERVMRDALDRHLVVLGPDHPSTLIATNNLARVVLDLGRAAEAEAMYEDMLPRAHRTLPAGHPPLASFRTGHGLTLAALERFAEAERELETAAAAFEAVYGPEHAATIKARTRLADLYEAWGKPDRAAAVRPPATAGSSSSSGASR